MATLPNIGIKVWRFNPAREPQDNLSALQTCVDSILSAFRRFSDVGLINALRFPALTIAGGSYVVINHGLGRIPQGWYVTRLVGLAIIYEDSTLPPTTSSLTLNATAATVIDVVVF